MRGFFNLLLAKRQNIEVKKLSVHKHSWNFKEHDLSHAKLKVKKGKLHNFFFLDDY